MSNKTIEKITQADGLAEFARILEAGRKAMDAIVDGADHSAAQRAFRGLQVARDAIEKGVAP